MDRPLPDALTLLGEARDVAEHAFVPWNVLIEVTVRCNESCAHCYRMIRRERPEIPTARWVRLLDEIRDAGCLFLTLTGGEVTLHPGLWDVLDRARALHLAVNLFTNGTRVDPSTAERFAAYPNIFKIEMSLYGSKAETHDGITRLSGSFQLTVAAAERLKALGVDVGFKFVLMRPNIEEFEAMEAFAAERGIYFTADAKISPRNDGKFTPLPLRPTDDQLRRFYARTLRGCAAGGCAQPGAGEDGGGFLCSVGQSLCAINAYGDMYPCIAMPISGGSILERSFRDIWEHAPIFREVRRLKLHDLPVCRACELRSTCERCPGMAFLENGGLTAPSTEACRHAAIVREVLVGKGAGAHAVAVG